MLSGDDETRTAFMDCYFPPSAASYLVGSVSSRVFCIKQSWLLVGQESLYDEETWAQVTLSHFFFLKP